uniref:Sigma-70 region 2 domain protein n=1 Tax=Rhodopseudomonas palustris (strain BisA53) TaxID=316055 RepID=Q07PM2_RHOP5
MPGHNFSNLNESFIAFLGGDRRAGEVVYAQMSATILTVVHRRAPDLPNDRQDVLNEVFVLMMESPRRYDPTRGSASAFITSVLVPEGIQRVRAKMVRAGATTRRRKPPKPTLEATFTIQEQLPAPDALETTGYGSPTAMEAACDAHVIWSRSEPGVRALIGGLMDGKAQAEIASDLAIDRFKVGRIFKKLQHQFAEAA